MAAKGWIKNVPSEGQAMWLDYCGEFGLSRYPPDLVASNKLVLLDT